MPEAIIIPLRGRSGSRPLAERDDDELMLLVRAAHAGAGDAMAALVGRYHARLLSFATRRIGDPAAAEEIVQEAFVRLWRQRADYRAEGKLATLLYMTVRNLCSNHGRWWRRRSRWLAPLSASSAGELPEAGAIDPSQIDALLDRERAVEIAAAVSALGVKLREAVVLRFEHGLPYDEIAAIVGANESTVRSRVHLALAELRARLVAPMPLKGAR